MGREGPISYKSLGKHIEIGDLRAEKKSVSYLAIDVKMSLSVLYILGIRDSWCGGPWKLCQAK